MVAPLVLGIETSCDETGIALVRGMELLADVTASSMDQHARYGGIIPEIAARAQLDELGPTLRGALESAAVSIRDVDAIAVTAGPGLIGSLTIGGAAAKGLALALDKPIYGVNHVIAHAWVDELVHGPFPDQWIALIVSGGHSALLLVDNARVAVRELGSTLDDAAGEAFDKVGRLLGLPYPGGPYVDELAKLGRSDAISFPRGLTAPKYAKTHPYDFSFSGLKTAVARYVENSGLDFAESHRKSPGLVAPQGADIAASFAAAVVDVLTAKAIAACRDFAVDTLVIGGGFSANSQLRELAAKRCAQAGVRLRIPPPRLCTDNGAMIAALGWAAVRGRLPSSSLDFSLTSALDLTTIVV